MTDDAEEASEESKRRPSGPPRAIRVLVPAIVLALGGCAAVGPDYEPPRIETPGEFFSETERGLARAPAELSEWWSEFDDETLEDLMARALERNLGLREALERIDEARAFRGIVTPDLYPTVDVEGAYSRNRLGVEGAGIRFGNRTSDSFGIGLQASWEIDLWGRVRRSVEAADAEIDASVEDARDVLVSVLAETARTYVDLREAQERERIARANIDLQARTLELTRDRFDAGLVSELDVVQASSILEGTRSTLPPLQARGRAARNRIALLLGLHPGALEADLSRVGTIPAPPLEIAIGIPAELLHRRPDIRRSERAIAAQNARIGAAEAELYPRIALSGNLGLSADDAASLFTGGALGFGIGPSFTWNVFDRSRIHSGVAVASSRRKQAAIRYESVVLRALEEVENAMTGFVRDQASRDALTRAVAETRRAVELSQEQYRQGLVSFQSVLDTQQRLFELEDTLAVTKASIAIDVILLYRALGGGWESRDIVLESHLEPEEEESP